MLAPGAHVVGKVILHDNASVWFNAVLRGDCDLIEVGWKAVMFKTARFLHLLTTVFQCAFGKELTIRHKVMLHGC